MKFAIRTMVAAAALVAVGVSQATAGTLAVGGSINAGGYAINSLSGEGTLTFSSALIGALNAGKVQVTAVAPATAPVIFKTNAATQVVSISSVSAAAPVTSLTGDFTSVGVTVTGVATAGGTLQTAATSNIATNGGSLQITNLNVDLIAKRVYADLLGGNGVGAKANVYLWDIAQVTGPTFIDLSKWPLTGYAQSTVNNTLSGLTINAAAFDLFATSLGLTANGITSLKTVKDFGVITSTITVSSVPEPETLALMGLGLAGISLTTRRRRVACHSVV